MNKSSLPFVSVITPVYNSEEYIDVLVASLLNQDYPKDRYEVIIIDNNSSDKTKELLSKYNIIVLDETEIQSSYAARNRGLEIAKGDVLAFIDADCEATDEWISQGIAAMQKHKADLVGGRVKFNFRFENSPAEIYDSLIHLRIDENIKERQVACTCNLFAKREVFEKIGNFDHTVKSGGDMQWTGKAIKNGHSLIYAPLATVMHPTRDLKGLMFKAMRTGAGKPYIWVANNEPLFKFKFLCLVALPSTFSYIRQLIRDRGAPRMMAHWFGVWMVNYWCKIFFLLGVLSSITKLALFSKKSVKQNEKDISYHSSIQR